MRIIPLLLILFSIQSIADYDRRDWPHWKDLDGDCLNTRAEILVRDSLQEVIFRPSNNCLVDTGRWLLPYTGGLTFFASDIDIDHVIPLKWANDRGAETWSTEEKQVFANDSENLLATSKSANRSKGAKGPEDWQPAINQCQYAIHWKYLLTKYKLETPVETNEAIQALCSIE